MSISIKNIVPLTLARSRLSELADEAHAGQEKIITKNGESYVALIDARQLDHYHDLEKEKIHLVLLEDAKRGLDDVIAGRTVDAMTAIKKIKNEIVSPPKKLTLHEGRKKRG